MLLVAHDVNPILGYLDRVVYFAGGTRGRGHAGRGDHDRDAEPALRRAGRGAARERRPSRRRRPARGAVRAPASRALPRPGHEHEAAIFQGLSWNLFGDVRQLVAYHFMVNALEAGTAVAVMAGAIGWFMVLRRQTFAGHTLAVIAFPGRRGCEPCGPAARSGLLRRLRGGGRSRSPASPPTARRQPSADESAAIGHRAGVRARPRVPVRRPLPRLAERSRRAAVRHVPRHHRQRRYADARAESRAGACSLLAVAGRPLLFASVDGDVARARRRSCGRALARLPALARPGGGGHEPDHRRAARLRPPRRACGGGAAAHCAAAQGPGAVRRRSVSP